MLLQYFVVVAFLILGTVAVDLGKGLQSKECAFTKSKPFSCLYFVMKEDLNHEQAAEYCFNQFNGKLVPLYYSYDEAIEVMKRYFWWAYSKMDVPRLRFGMWNKARTTFRFTLFNPTENLGKDVDMVIWYRSFDKDLEDSHRPMSVDRSMYDETFTYQEIRYESGNFDTYFYMALKPTTLKWSRVNYNDTIPFICEVPRFPKAYCEPGWWLHMKSRSCFYINNIDLKFFDAVNACHAMGSNLASINDETENNMVLRMIDDIIKDNSKVWFGLRWNAAKSKDLNIPDKNGDNFTIFYDYFVKNMAYNIDGTPVTNFHHFDVEGNQPDGWRVQEARGGQIDTEEKVENCLLYEKTNRKWHDYNCDVQIAHSVCRKMSSTQPYQ